MGLPAVFTVLQEILRNYILYFYGLHDIFIVETVLIELIQNRHPEQRGRGRGRREARDDYIGL